jgi:hypothetical protein
MRWRTRHRDRIAPVIIESYFKLCVNRFVAGGRCAFVEDQSGRGKHDSSPKGVQGHTQRFPIVMEEVTDPEQLAKAHAQDERFDRNFAWFQSHATEIFERTAASAS